MGEPVSSRPWQSYSTVIFNSTNPFPSSFLSFDLFPNGHSWSLSHSYFFFLLSFITLFNFCQIPLLAHAALQADANVSRNKI